MTAGTGTGAAAGAPRPDPDVEFAPTLEDVDAFIAATVIPLEDRHRELLDDPRRRFDPSGRYAEEVLELKRRVRTAAAGAGLYALAAPADCGGGGAGPSQQYAVWEHLYRTCGPNRLLPYDVVAHPSGGPGPAFALLSPEARGDALPGLMSGQDVLCVAFTELGEGIATIATPEGDGWVLDGTKHWVSRGPYAGRALVFAVTDRHHRGGDGLTAFLVSATAPGFRVESVSRILGRVGGEEATVSLSGVRVAAGDVVGEVHEGRAVSAVLNAAGDCFTAGRFVGLARWALERTVRFVADDGSLASDAAVRRLLADAAIDIHAARRMSIGTVQLMDAGRAAGMERAMTRTHVVEMCGRVYERCMQIHGGSGLTNDAGFFDGWHQVRIVLSALGPGDPLRARIADRLSQGDLAL